MRLGKLLLKATRSQSYPESSVNKQRGEGDISFIVLIIVLMVLFYGEPDLFDAIRAYLISSVQSANSVNY